MSFVNASNSGITSCPLKAFTMITMLGLITLKEENLVDVKDGTVSYFWNWLKSSLMLSIP